MSRAVTDETPFQQVSGDEANARSGPRSGRRSGTSSMARLRAVRGRLYLAVTLASVMMVLVFGDDGEAAREFVPGFVGGLAPGLAYAVFGGALVALLVACHLQTAFKLRAFPGWVLAIAGLAALVEQVQALPVTLALIGLALFAIAIRRGFLRIRFCLSRRPCWFGAMAFRGSFEIGCSVLACLHFSRRVHRCLQGSQSLRVLRFSSHF